VDLDPSRDLRAGSRASPDLQRDLVAVYGLFFLSGFSGLVYQVIWVRLFGNVFGNTVYSAAVVTAVFMGGLGLGSYLAGIYADRRTSLASLVRAYAVIELLIGIWGWWLSVLVPRSAALASAWSTYSHDGNGWWEPSTSTMLIRCAMAVVLLLPACTLMGATLTLLVRGVVQPKPSDAGWRVGLLYGLNTAGAALGCLLTDLVLVPKLGVARTQWVAVVVNLVVAGFGLLVGRSVGESEAPSGPHLEGENPASDRLQLLLLMVALGFSGFAGMGLELVWFRFLGMTLGESRAAFSTTLTVMLACIWLGSTLSGLLQRRWRNALELWAIAQGVLCVAVLLSFGWQGLSNAQGIARLLPKGDSTAFGRFLGTPLALQYLQGLASAVLLVGLSSVLMGFAFPLANAHLQRSRSRIGHRAGGLYAANTLGAVIGSLATGFFLIPWFGSQRTLATLMACVGVSILALIACVLETSGVRRTASRATLVSSGALACALISVIVWSSLPPMWLLTRNLPQPRLGGRYLDIGEGINEVLAINQQASGVLSLETDGHPMSDTSWSGQRYQRAFSHLPLLMNAHPQDVLVICFGVGNTAQAALLHPSVRRVDVADLSKQVLEHAHFFRDLVGEVLGDPRVATYIDDGRERLRTVPPETYDLITLEPPPIYFAGVSALYSREFYELARSRLKPGGYLTQWLPAYQVSPDEQRAAVRAFLEAFPNAALLSGANQELILLGEAGGDSRLDLDRVERRLAESPEVERDLRRWDLGTLTHLVGMYVASGEELNKATTGVESVTDDNPSLEWSYDYRWRAEHLAPELFPDQPVSDWCPECVRNGVVDPRVADLPGYMHVLRAFYRQPAWLRHRGIRADETRAFLGEIHFEKGSDAERALAGSPYLQDLIGVHRKTD
jgi:spermidine synthase